jgi:hypothetical protein
MNKNLKFKNLFLLALLILQIVAPSTLLAKRRSPMILQKKLNYHLPSRTALKDIAASWTGLHPALYVKNKSSKVGSLDTPEGTIKFVGAVKGSLKKGLEIKPVAEALEFLNELASPGQAIEQLNLSKRTLLDLQTFGDDGFFKNINRTSLALGQALQITQIYQGAPSEDVAIQRRNLITNFIENPKLTKALCLRIQNFQQFEAGFLRQTNAPVNPQIEAKINSLAPSRLFGPLAQDKRFIGWHALLTQKMAHWPFVGYEHIKATHFFMLLATVIGLIATKTGKNGFKNLIDAIKTRALKRASKTSATATAQPPAEPTTPGAAAEKSSPINEKNIVTMGQNMITAYFNRYPDFRMILIEWLYNWTLSTAERQKASVETVKQTLTTQDGIGIVTDLTTGPIIWIPKGLVKLFGFLGSNLKKPLSMITSPLTPHLRRTGDQLKKIYEDVIPADSMISQKKNLLIAKFQAMLAHEKFALLSQKAQGLKEKISQNQSLRMNTISQLPENALELIEELVKRSPEITEYFVINDEDEGKLVTPGWAIWNWINPWAKFSDTHQDTMEVIDSATTAAGGTDGVRNKFRAAQLFQSLFPSIGKFFSHDIGQLPSEFDYLTTRTWLLAQDYMFAPFMKILNIYFGSSDRAHWNWGFMGKRMREMIYSMANPFAKDFLKKNAFVVKEIGGKKFKFTFEPHLMNLMSLIRTTVGSPLVKSYLFIPSLNILNRGINDRAYNAEEMLKDFDPRSLQMFSVREVADDGSELPGAPKLTPAEAADKFKFFINDADKIKELREIFHLKKLDGLQGGPLTNAQAHNNRTALIKGRLKTASLGIEAIIGGLCLAFGLFWSEKMFNPMEKKFMYETLDEYMFMSLKPSIALAELTRQMSGIFKQYKDKLHLPDSLRDKFEFLMNTQSANCQEFSAIAQEKLFLAKDCPGTFGDFGSIRKAYQLMKKPDVKEWLNVCAVIMAELDSYIGVARLVVEHKDIPNYYSPVTFAQQEKPLIDLEEFWFPLLNAYTQKSNSITMGKLEDENLLENNEAHTTTSPHVLLTGINGCGKSIVLKGAVFCIMMAKTFGWAPLKSGTMTFFDNVIIHLSSTDNAAEGESCWISEAKAMGEAIHAMQAPRQGTEKILFIGDELGSGTADHASIASVAHLIQIAVNSPHVASIISTHLRPLTRLERITNGLILNYCVGRRLLADGSIEGRFQLQRGRAENNIAEKIVNDLISKGMIDINEESSEENRAIDKNQINISKELGQAAIPIAA